VDKLKPSEQTFWKEYLAFVPPSHRPRKPFVAAAFAGNRKTTDALIALYLAGKKSAGSGLVRDYLKAGDRLPDVGDFWIALDSRNRPRCLLKTVRVEFNLFRKVPRRIAVAEGEGDRSLAHWRRVHRKFFSPFLEEWGIEELDEAEVITEHFRLVHRRADQGPSPSGEGPIL
jgi:uncharacterized protein YhfF